MEYAYLAVETARVIAMPAALIVGALYARREWRAARKEWRER